MSLPPPRCEARRRRHEYLTLEHVLYAMTQDRVAAMILRACGADPLALRKALDRFFEENVESLPDEDPRERMRKLRRLNDVLVLAVGTEQLVIRIDLDA